MTTTIPSLRFTRSQREARGKHTSAHSAAWEPRVAEARQGLSPVPMFGTAL